MKQKKGVPQNSTIKGSDASDKLLELNEADSKMSDVAALIKTPIKTTGYVEEEPSPSDSVAAKRPKEDEDPIKVVDMNDPWSVKYPYMSVTWSNQSTTMMESLIVLLHSGAFYDEDASDVYFSVEHPSDTGPSVLVIESTIPEEYKNTNKLFERIMKAMQKEEEVPKQKAEEGEPTLYQLSEESDDSDDNHANLSQPELENWFSRKQAF